MVLTPEQLRTTALLSASELATVPLQSGLQGSGCRPDLVRVPIWFALSFEDPATWQKNDRPTVLFLLGRDFTSDALVVSGLRVW